MLHIKNLQRRFRPDSVRLRFLVDSLCNDLGIDGDISLVLMNDKKIREVNRKFLSHDFPTDVLAFPMKDEQDSFIGEILISTETALYESTGRNISIEEEVVRYLVHGILHLCGYQDHTPSKRRAMFDKQEIWVNRYLARFKRDIRC